MSRDEANALLALKNAWLGVVTSAEALQAAAPGVQQVDEQTPLKDLDLPTYHRLVGTHANAVMALRGLIDELERQAAKE
ncbi:MAG: hypothetical protein O2917_04855 [Acidobacteria bacterium]|nr:hypothetical protein [Acidobacteriota bacterium]